MPSATLNEDIVDDVLYYTRVSDLASLQSILSTVSTNLATPAHDVLSLAVDTYTGNTTLHMAAANGHTEVLKLLLDLLPTPSDSTALRESDSAVSVASMLVNRKNQSGNTALHWAALNGHLEAAKLLVGAGASLDVTNEAGHGAIFEAAKAEKEDVVAWLLGAAKEKENGGESAREEEVIEVASKDEISGEIPDS